MSIMFIKVNIEKNQKKLNLTGLILLKTEFIFGLKENGSGSSCNYQFNNTDRREESSYLEIEESNSYIKGLMSLIYMNEVISLNVYDYNDPDKETKLITYNIKDIIYGIELNGNTYLYILDGAFKLKKVLVDHTFDEIIALTVNEISIDKTIYVSDTGNDEKDGSLSTPFLTLERALLSITNSIIKTDTEVIIQLSATSFNWTNNCRLYSNTIYLESASSLIRIIGSYDTLSTVSLSATADPFVYDVLVGGIAPTWTPDEYKYSIFNIGTNVEAHNFPITTNTADTLESFPDLSSGQIFTLTTTLNIPNDSFIFNSSNTTIINNDREENFRFEYLKLDFASTSMDNYTKFTFFGCVFLSASVFRFNSNVYVRGCSFTNEVLITEKVKLFASNYVYSSYADGVLRFYSDSVVRGFIVEGVGTNKGIEVRGGDIVSNNLSGSRVGYKIKNCSHAFSLSRGTFSSGPVGDPVIIDNCNYYLNPYGFPAELDLIGLAGNVPLTDYIDGFSNYLDLKNSIRLNIPGLDPLNDVLFSNVLKLTPLATPPTSPSLGWVYVSTDTNIYFYDGSIWVQLS